MKAFKCLIGNHDYSIRIRWIQKPVALEAKCSRCGKEVYISTTSNVIQTLTPGMKAWNSLVIEAIKQHERAQQRFNAKTGESDFGSFRKPKGIPNWYVILRVSENADAITVRNAYRKLAKEYHPDRGGNEQMFQDINSAYEHYTKHIKQ